jgi:hypothetical protein
MAFHIICLKRDLERERERERESERESFMLTSQNYRYKNIKGRHLALSFFSLLDYSAIHVTKAAKNT